MKKSLSAAITLTMLISTSAAFAAEALAKVELNTTIGRKASLTITNPNPVVQFNDSAMLDNDLSDIQGSQTIGLRAQVRSNGDAFLTVAANSNFVGPGGYVIPVANVSSAEAGPFAAVASMPQTSSPAILAGGLTSGIYEGEIAYSLKNSWDYTPGIYSPVELTYTLSAP
jgi:hypothetical protein